MNSVYGLYTQAADCKKNPSMTESDKSRTINTLPFDILYIIFVQACELDEDRRINYGYGLGRSIRFPTTLSHVSHSWRVMALDSPILWTSIRFEDRISPDFGEQALWIQRSQSAGLNIYIHGCYKPKLLTGIMRLVRPHIKRWVSFSVAWLYLQDKPYRNILDQLRYASAPKLQALEVANRKDKRGWVFQPFEGGTPNLRYLKIGSGRVNTRLNLWKGLTKLVITPDIFNDEPQGNYITTTDIFIILSHSADTLEEFCLTNCGGIGPRPSFLPLVLKNLHHLTMGDGYIYSSASSLLPWIQEIYCGIQAPKLRAEEFHPLLLHNVLTKSASFPYPGLQELEIGWCYADARELAPMMENLLSTSLFVSLLAQLPELRKLDILDISFFDHRVLGNLCPKLESLMLSWPKSSNGWKTSNLKAMIEARRHNATAAGRTTDSLIHINLSWVVLPVEEVAWMVAQNGIAFTYAPDILTRITHDLSVPRWAVIPNI